MTCTECEQLFDAYLDGQLTGALRLEFDAHRLRCRRCQQTLAMLEAVGNVLSADAEPPTLSDDFTDRVMQSVAPAATQTRRFPRWRVTLATVALAQAAAILLFVSFRPDSTDTTPPPVIPVSNDPLAARADLMDDPAFQGLRGLITERIQDRVWAMWSDGMQLPQHVRQLATGLDFKLPDEYVRASEKVVDAGPLQLFLNSPTSDDAESSDRTDDDLHSL